MSHRIVFAAAGLAALGVLACRSSRYEGADYSGSRSSPAPSTWAPEQEPAMPAPVALERRAEAPAIPVTEIVGRKQVVYATPEEALRDLAAVAQTADRDRAEKMFGPGSLEILESGDEAADREDGVRVAGMIQEKLEFEDAPPDHKFAVVGKDAWRLPIPLKKVEGGWSFDLQAGDDEMLTRRIGRNELFTVDALQGYICAQRDYAAESREGKYAGYAKNFMSAEGTRDGLYWETQPGEKESPVGPLIAAAARSDDQAVPFHGYYYRVLSKQGKAAPGGEKDFIDGKGAMTGGCAAIAWPARYGNSGVMTFIVSQDGIVFEKDLGPDTAEKVREITAYDPDSTWAPSDT
jgi:hypothetical protein